MARLLGFREGFILKMNETKLQRIVHQPESRSIESRKASFRMLSTPESVAIMTLMKVEKRKPGGVFTNDARELVQ